MKTFYCDHFVLPLPDDHRFPMEKYALLRSRVGTHPGIDLRVPDPARDEELLLVHHPRYVEDIVHGRLTPRGIRRIGFPWSPGLVERSRRSVGGTIAAARAALRDGVGVNLAGGTHHAFSDHGEGFCVFNDVAIAIRTLRAEGLVRRAVVLDLDVHQGNGTAAVFREDPDVFTLSVHGAGNYPFEKERSDLDLPLRDGAGDAAYLRSARVGVERALRSGADLALYVAGADPYTGDRLGRLSVSRWGLATRDRMVFALCAAAGVPVATVMSGGYARTVADTVEIHARTVLEAVRCRPGGGATRVPSRVGEESARGLGVGPARRPPHAPPGREVVG